MTVAHQPQSGREGALEALRRNWPPVPLEPRSKKPIPEGWPDLRLGIGDVDRYFGDGQNVGVLLAPSNLFDCDLDWPEAEKLAPHFLPKGAAIFGRASKPRSHYLYKIGGAFDGLPKFAFPGQEHPILDARTSGQTMFVGSTHPSGERVEWADNCERPYDYQAPILEAAVRKLAAALLLRFYPAEGTRHDAIRAAAGVLLEGAGWSEGEVSRFVLTVARAAGDAKLRDRETEVRSAAEEIRKGRHVPQHKKMAEHFGQPFAEHFLNFLGIEPGRRQEVATTTTLIVERISDIPRREIEWLWHPRIALGKLTIPVGDPGLGKSLATLDWAARVTTGTAWPDGAPNGKTGSVILLSAEDDPGDTIRPRLEAAGANIERIHHIYAARVERPGKDGAVERAFDLHADLDALRGLIRKIGDVRLVIIDPISAYMPGIDSHKNSEVRAVLTPVARLAMETMVAVVAISHLSKGAKGKGSALYRVIASIGFVAAARAVWLFCADPADENRRLMLPGKNNLAPKGTGLAFTIDAPNGVPRVVWAGSSDVLADDVLDAEGRKERAEEREAVAWLREFLGRGAVESTQVQKAAKRDGLKWGAVRDAKAILGVRPAKEGFTGPWWWELPKKEAPEDAEIP